MIRIFSPHRSLGPVLLAACLLAGSARAVHAQGMPRATVSFEGASMREVAAFFADFADRSIVLGEGVGGVVSAEIQSQPWDLALQAILLSQGLYARELASGIILIEDPGTTTAAPKPAATRVFRLSYTPAAELQPVVQSMLSESGTASVLASINALVVTDAPDVLDRVAALLR